MSSASVSFFNSADNGRRATIKSWPDGVVLLSLYASGRLRLARKQPSQSVAREIALNWTRGIYASAGEVTA